MNTPIKSPKIYVLAGEESGDVLMTPLMQDLQAFFDGKCQFYGVGGRGMSSQMTGQGGQSLFPMQELSVMGLTEVLPRLLPILARIRQVVGDIVRVQPDLILSVDAPDFSFRVIKGVRRKMKNAPVCIHYVAPTVWAWRAGRAAKIARFLDGLLCLLPFEPPYFTKHGLAAAFVGHPVLQTPLAQLPNFRDEAANVTGLFFGSRGGEVARNGAVILEAAKILQAQNPDMRFVVPTLPHLVQRIAELLKPLKNVTIAQPQNTDEKATLFSQCHQAIAVSGTVGLELAVAGVPHIIVYKLQRLTYWLARFLVKTPYAHLGNIVLQSPLIPELIQDSATPDAVVDALQRAVRDQKTNQIAPRVKESLTSSQNSVDFIVDRLYNSN
jgi:lipid-A-disaccharide synthase